MDSLELAEIIASEALDTKGQELKILDLKGLVSYTDYFVIVTGTSNRHVQAISDRVHLKLKKSFRKLPLHLEGYASGQWILLDYGDVVLHVFLEEQREYYGLDDLWRDAPLLSLSSLKKSRDQKIKNAKIVNKK